ncbi:uncharacterized protein [Ptychodera flava]
MAKTSKDNGAETKKRVKLPTTPTRNMTPRGKIEKPTRRSSKTGMFNWFWKSWNLIKSACSYVTSPRSRPLKPRMRRQILPSPVKRTSVATVLERRNSITDDEVARKPKKLVKKEKYWTDHDMVITETGDAIQNGIHGPEYLFDVWLQMLARWFDQPGVKVYLVSPFLDSELLQDLITVMTSCGDGKRGRLEKLYTRYKCYNDISIDTLIKTGLEDDERKVFQRLIAKSVRMTHDEYYNKTYFHCKFLAGVYPSGRVELMVTSANFTRTHLGATYQQLDSLELKITNEEHFDECYLQPLDELTHEHQ